MPFDSAQLIGSAETADLLGVSVVTVNRWTSAGHLNALPVARPGKRPSVWLYNRAEIERIAARRAEAERVLAWAAS